MCRTRGNKITFACLVESGEILSEAKAKAGRLWSRWLREEARMGRETARRHMLVAEFARKNGSLTSKLASLSIAKIYTLLRLDSAMAEEFLSGQRRLSAPLEELTDVQFREEMKAFLPGPKRIVRREKLFRKIRNAAVRLRELLRSAAQRAREMTVNQKKEVARLLEEIRRASDPYSEVA
jgi:hypothetical protein